MRTIEKPCPIEGLILRAPEIDLRCSYFGFPKKARSFGGSRNRQNMEHFWGQE